MELRAGMVFKMAPKKTDAKIITGEARGGARVFGRLRAHHLFDLYAMQIAPALAATLVGLFNLPDAAVAFALGLAALGVNLLLARVPLPFHLMPVARFAVRVAAPVIAAAIVVPLAAYGGHPVALAALVPSIVAATLTTSLGAWLKAIFDSSVEVRIGVIGCPADADAVAVEIANAGVAGYRVVGAIVPHDGCLESARGPAAIGRLSSLRAAVSRHSIDLLVNVPVSDRGPQAPGAVGREEVFEHASGACLGLPVRMLQLSQFCEDVLGHVPVGSIDSGWFQYMMHPRFRADSAPGKRVFDVIVAGLARSSWLRSLRCAALAVRISDGGPAFYRQPRVGENGRLFDIAQAAHDERRRRARRRGVVERPTIRA